MARAQILPAGQTQMAPMAKDPLDILTPQGYLSEVMDDPSLEVVMNLFKIPRAFAVSGFGDWSVGRHCFCVAWLALYWSRFRGYDEATRNRLVVMGLSHDLHEAATGDILPGLKNPELKARLDEIQSRFLKGLDIAFEDSLHADLKALDMMAFMFEIRQAAVLDQEQGERLEGFFSRQKAALLEFAATNRMEGVEGFLEKTGLGRMAERGS